MIVRRILVALAVPVILFLIANVVLERMAEGRVASAVQDHFDLREKPSVQLSGFPIVVNVLRGDLPELSFTADDVTVEGLELRHVEAELRDISADSGSFLTGSVRVTVGHGRVAGDATEDALNSFLRKRKERARVALHEGSATVRARRVIAGEVRTIRARGSISIRRGVLRFTPSRVTVDGGRPPRGLEDEARRKATIEVALPDLPGDIQPTGLDTHEGTIEIEATLRRYKLDLS